MVSLQALRTEFSMEAGEVADKQRMKKDLYNSLLDDCHQVAMTYFKTDQSLTFAVLQEAEHGVGACALSARPSGRNRSALSPRAAVNVPAPPG
jgi:hypothetical protein